MLWVSRSTSIGSPELTTLTAADLRAQAAHARQLADNMYNRQAQAELRQVADALEAQAQEMEGADAAKWIPPPAQDA